MEKKSLILIVLISLQLGNIEATFIRPPATIWSHPQLTNGEKWIDYLQSTKLGKLYNLYHDMQETDIEFSEFEFVQPDPMEHFIPTEGLYTKEHTYVDTL